MIKTTQILRLSALLLLALLVSCGGSNGGLEDAGEDAAGDAMDGQAGDGDPGTDRAADGGDGVEGDDGGGDGDISGDDGVVELSLSSVDPAQGGASVPTQVSLLGTGFADGLEVYVGGVPATDIDVVSTEEASAVFGAVEPIDCGKKDVRVVLGGEESVLVEGFEYVFDEDPIVFVHGYVMTSAEWNTMIQNFRDRGYPDDRLFAIDYTNSLDSNIIHARDELSAFVNDVMLQTGADRVDLVGHSNGGTSSRLFVAIFGGHNVVRDFVSVSGTHHGNQMACLAGWTGESAEEQCPAYASEEASHNLVQWMLNGDPDTPDIDETPYGIEDGGSVAYSALWTEDDLIDIPPHVCCLNQMFRGDCSDPINIMFSGIGHIEMASNSAVIDTVFDLVRRHNASKP
jgi:triacylglycerol lipase